MPDRRPHPPWAPKDGERVVILANEWSLAHGWNGRTGTAHLKAGMLFTVVLDQPQTGEPATLHVHLRELAPAPEE